MSSFVCGGGGRGGMNAPTCTIPQQGGPIRTRSALERGDSGGSAVFFGGGGGTHLLNAPTGVPILTYFV